MPRIDVERFGARLRMGAHDRMHGLQGLALAFLAHVCPDLVGLGRRVEPTERREQGLHPIRQGFIRRHLTGEQRIAADRRDFPGEKHGRGGRAFQVRRVRMPDATEIPGLLRLLDDRRDDGISVDTGHERIDVRLAHRLGERDLLLRREVLAADDQHVVAQESRFESRDDRLRQWPVQAQSPDLQPDDRRQKPTVERRFPGIGCASQGHQPDSVCGITADPRVR